MFKINLITIVHCLYWISGVISDADEFTGMNLATVSHPAEPQILQFESEEEFMEKFGDNEIAEIFSNSSKRIPDLTIPGDMGLPVVIEDTSHELQEVIDQGKRIFGYNKYVSDLIPSRRRLPENRGEWCFTPDRFLQTLLPTSVIMCFYNEALSVLLRSIHSILDRSPAHLLSEIILIDDFSDLDDLKDKLDAEIRNLTKVRLVRLPQREGLIRARLIGSDLAVAPVLTFLDSHVEVSDGWLEPLLDRVTRNWKTIACPIMDYINPESFSYNNTGEYADFVGGFNWDITYTSKAISEEDKMGLETPADPIPSPTMPGGLFSIHRNFFDYLGKYDEMFEIWGGENMELSFKAWMCGGRIEVISCSHIGHLERTIPIYPKIHGIRNTERLVAVWLDEYAEFYYARNGPHASATTDHGDISSRLALKKELNCSSFDWYMNNIIPDQFNPKHSIYSGEVRNLEFEQDGSTEALCLDAHMNENPSSINPSGFYSCHGLGGNQYWHYTPKGEIRKFDKCLDYAGGSELSMIKCHGHQGNQYWEYHSDTGVIIDSSGLCLTLDDNNGKIVMLPCSGEMNQKWRFQ